MRSDTLTIALPGLVLSLLLAATALADTPTTQTPESGDRSVAGDGTGDPDTSRPEVSDDEVGERAGAPATEDGEAGDSPFDYEASEEISEDLSVSFPVDI